MTTPPVTRVAVSADPADHRAWVTITTGHLRGMLLSTTGSTARVALVPRTALLLAGDHVRIEVHVGPGAGLELVEPGGTVAYAMHGSSADWDVTITVDAGGRLVWHGEPFVVAESARVTRTTSVVLGPGATLALRETLVLGRDGEGPGRLTSRTRVDLGDRALLVEDLTLGPESGVPGVLGDHRVLDQVLDLRPDAGSGTVPGEGEMRLEPFGVLHRRLGREAHEASLATVWPPPEGPQGPSIGRRIPQSD